MQKKAIIFIGIICCLLIVGIILQNRVVTTVKYFPIDASSKMEQAETKLKTDEKNENIQWFVASNSSQPMYLRQDISLLFANGRFVGLQNEWKQDVSEISMAEHFKPSDSVYLEAITFHHGEIHQSSDNIKSTQYMTMDQQYVYKNNVDIKLITNSTLKNDQLLKEKLKKNTNQQLHQSWSRLLDYYKIDSKKYHAIPLTHLVDYMDHPLPNQSIKNTEQIIGQLWEGLYQNYVLALHEDNHNRKNQYMPLILIAKDQSHLLVLFNVDGKNQLLKQQLPAD